MVNADNALCAVVVPHVAVVECPLVSANAHSESVVDASSVKINLNDSQ